MRFSFRPLFLILCLSVLTTSCARNRETFYFGNYSEAEQLYNKGEYEKAIQKYQAYRDENPEGNLAVIALYYMGKSHAALGHKDEATKIFQQISKENPNVVWANFSETQLKELEKMPASKVKEPEKIVIKEKPRRKKRFLFF